MPHDTDFDHEHEALSEADRLEMARYIWSQENVELRTIGIDIGSSTSHLLFAKVVLQRQTQGLSSRFLVVSREVEAHAGIDLGDHPLQFVPVRGRRAEHEVRLNPGEEA